LRFAAIYGTGTVMGYSPQEVRAMSMWQYFAALDGWRKANSPDDSGLSKQEEDALWELVQAKSRH
jgi:hypothetical protein